MGTWAASSGRLLAAVGVGAGTASLAARVLMPTAWGPWWLAAPALAVELTAVLSVALLVWAAGGGRRSADDVLTGVAPLGTASTVDVVVRAPARAATALRTTLVGTAALRKPLHVVDLGNDGDVRAVAAEYGARVVPVACGDLNGLTAAAVASTADALFVLDAGAVPAPDALHRLVPLLAADVAAVQGGMMMASGDRRTGGVVVDRFDRGTLNPWLGRRGCSVIDGSGALVRRALLADASPVGSPTIADAELTAALFASGWRIVAAGGRAVAVAAAAPAAAELGDDTARAAAARHLAFGLHGAIAPNRLTIAQRLALLAWCSRALGGIRRGVVIALLLVCMLCGRLPYSPSSVSGALALLSVVAGSVGLALASGGALRVGDRSRESVRTLGAAWSGVLAGALSEPRREASGVATFGITALLALSFAMRGVSDRFTHTLGTLPAPSAAVLLLFALWTLALLLESSSALAAPRRRTAGRVTTAATVTMIDASAVGRKVRIVDVSAFGMSTFGNDSVVVGERLCIVSEDAHVRVDGVVRHVRTAEGGRSLVGIEFLDVEPQSADAIARDLVVPAALRSLGAGAMPSAVAPPAFDRSRAAPEIVSGAALRIAALVAAGGAVLSVGPLTNGSAARIVAAAASALVLAVAMSARAARRDVVVVEVGVQRAAPAQSTSGSPDFAMR